MSNNVLDCALGYADNLPVSSPLPPRVGVCQVSDKPLAWELPLVLF